MKHNGMRPQDVVILLKIIAQQSQPWTSQALAYELYISQSETSESLRRSVFAGLFNEENKSVYRSSFLEFLVYGVKYVFPVKPGPIYRGMPTAHSAKPLSETIQHTDMYGQMKKALKEGSQ